MTVPNQVTSETFVHAVSEIARTRRHRRGGGARGVRRHARGGGPRASAARRHGHDDRPSVPRQARHAGQGAGGRHHGPRLRARAERGRDPLLHGPRRAALGAQAALRRVGRRHSEDRSTRAGVAGDRGARSAAGPQRALVATTCSRSTLPGDVFHVDALVEQKRVLFAGVHRYWRPPMDVAHKGGVFITTTVERGSVEERALLAMNQALVDALGFVRGATHAEFIRERGGPALLLPRDCRAGGRRLHRGDARGRQRHQSLARMGAPRAVDAGSALRAAVACATTTRAWCSRSRARNGRTPPPSPIPRSPTASRSATTSAWSSGRPASRASRSCSAATASRINDEFLADPPTAGETHIDSGSDQVQGFRGSEVQRARALVGG